EAAGLVEVDAASVASVLLLLAIWYVGDDGNTDGLRSWIFGAWRAAGIHGLIALTYAIWPKKAPQADSAVAARDPEHVPDLLVRGPREDEEQVR
ncbi:hypothetical protein ACFXGT_20685, partial [Streptomyces sp. NPDC059352]